MRVTLFSNFLNHHQTPFCDEMYKELGSNFTFVSTEKIPESFLKNGYPDCTDYVYNLNSYFDKTNFNKAIQLGLDSDIVIIGAAPEIFIKERLKINKHTFWYSERLFKRGLWQLFDPRLLLYYFRIHTQYRSKNVYMLCASAFAANDLDCLFAYPQKKYKWGYFTEVEELNIEQVLAQKPIERIEIIWIARFIDWKHPELAVKLAYELKNKGYSFHLNMIGSGEMADYINQLIEKLDVTECVSLLGNMPNSEVKNYLKKSHIFIFTSDQNEGWGAVLNEAMGCGCAVVASNSIGSAPFLIEHNKNGLVFNSESLSSLLQQTERLVNDKNFRDNLSINAYYTISKLWSPKKAVVNFMRLAKSIIDGEPQTIQEGPCSTAQWTYSKAPLTPRSTDS